jgi:hypothetical protein
MQGTITSKHVVLQAFTIIRLWGIGTWFLCLRAALSGEQTTFLRVLYPAPCYVRSSHSSVGSGR